MLIFSSLYGVKEEAIIETKEKEQHKVLINYSNRVPFIVVDDTYTKNTAFIQGESISYISKTLLYIMGDKTQKTMLILRGNTKKMSTGQSIIIGLGIVSLIMMVLYGITKMLG